MNVHELMELSKDNFSVFDGFAKAFSVISRYQPFGNIACSISGGKDSDIVLDIVSKFDPDKRIHYVWFDTGLEYQATRDHLKYLEERYDIKIERESNQAYSSHRSRIRSTFYLKGCLRNDRTIAKPRFQVGRPTLRRAC